MPKLPVVSGAEVIRALRRLGFIFIRQRGSHVIFAGVLKVALYLTTVKLKQGLWLVCLNKQGFLSMNLLQP
ncbi:MAG: type II toxin-antitoxin system HicA family toxin [Chlorobium sp.]